MSASDSQNGLLHGSVLGTSACGVVGYNCNYEEVAKREDYLTSYDNLNYIHDNSNHRLVCSGFKWQCVEFARRWWITQLDVLLPSVGGAHELWERNLKFVRRLRDGAHVDVQAFHNAVAKDDSAKPQLHDILIWRIDEHQPYGHVAVVSEVDADNVYICEQNYHNNQPWQQPARYARALPLKRDAQTGAWHIGESSLYGWLRVLPDHATAPNAFKPPHEDRTIADGDYGVGTATLLQKFLGITADGQHGRHTDYALAAFLNTHHPCLPKPFAVQLEVDDPAVAAKVKEHVREWSLTSSDAQSDAKSDEDAAAQHLRLPRLTPEFYPEFDRAPLIRKLQHFLITHSLISGSGVASEPRPFTVQVTGQWDSATSMGIQNILNRVLFAEEFAAAAAVYKAMGGVPPRPDLPHGEILGVTHAGVISYNCNYAHIVEPKPDEPPYDQLIYTQDKRGRLQYSGMKWQCVEYARRWWISQYDCTLLNVPRACDIWRRTYAKRLSDGASVALKMHGSGESTEKPAVGDLVIWKKTDEQPVGHVAVVCNVDDDRVYIAEQNVDNNIHWKHGHYSRSFHLQRDLETGAWSIRDDEDPLFGWVRVHPDQVVPSEPWVPPSADAQHRLPIDGVYDGATKTAFQIFVGLDVARDFGDVDITQGRYPFMIHRMTFYGLAAFLNVHHTVYEHVPMASFMKVDLGPIIKKLQHFLNAHPEFSCVGQDGLVIAETGELDAATTKGIQHLCNRIAHYEDWEEALAYYRGKSS